MVFEDYKTKQSVVVIYTGEGKGKTSASLGLMCRALGAGWRVAYIQFIKHWKVNEHNFIDSIKKVYGDKIYFYKGGAGFYKAGELSAKGVSQQEHKKFAQETLNIVSNCATNGEFDLVICDEINNAMNDGLIKSKDVLKLIKTRNPKTSLCFTGRNFPMELLNEVDIATEMTKLKHHFDDKYLANKGIDF